MRYEIKFNALRYKSVSHFHFRKHNTFEIIYRSIYHTQYTVHTSWMKNK